MHGRLWAASKLGLTIAIALLAGGQQRARGEEHAATQMAGSCTPAAFRVLVDVGHTLAVPGANSARGVPEYAFNLQLARDVKQALVAAGFEQTVLLITATAPWRGLFERAARANEMHANLFISIHHDSVPDNLKHNWEYAIRRSEYKDDYPGNALFITNDNEDSASSLLLYCLLVYELEARGMHYTPHYPS